mmetsp:Transcript_2273/g.7488  ORF Transcript_2273/g.7488 Transcript_2273/m.7488 type:complete len:200 (-) Transcript_2273:224-823(-)
MGGGERGLRLGRRAAAKGGSGHAEVRLQVLGGDRERDPRACVQGPHHGQGQALQEGQAQARQGRPGEDHHAHGGRGRRQGRPPRGGVQQRQDHEDVDLGRGAGARQALSRAVRPRAAPFGAAERCPPHAHRAGAVRLLLRARSRRLPGSAELGPPPPDSRPAPRVQPAVPAHPLSGAVCGLPQRPAALSLLLLAGAPRV